MSTIVIGRRRSGRRRSVNPREGVVSKPGEGPLVVAMILLIAAVMLAFAILPLAAMGSHRTVSEVVSSLTTRTPTVPASSDPGDALRQAVRVVDACPAVRPVVREMTKDRAFDADELVVLKQEAVKAGCAGN